MELVSLSFSHGLIHLCLVFTLVVYQSPLYGIPALAGLVLPSGATAAAIS
jgi:hypothetical protein